MKISSTNQPAAPVDWAALTLGKGSHSDGETDGCGNPLLCFMEALNVSRGGNITDSCPPDVSETLHIFIIGLNDALSTAKRQMLKPYRTRIIGTGGQNGADERAAYMCVDWLIRTYTPAFLRLAGLTDHADLLAGAGEVVDLVTLGGVTDYISAARSEARSAADSVIPARSAAAFSAARSAAASAAASAAHSAAFSAARSAAYSAADSAARSAAVWSAADSAAQEKLESTVAALQASAFDLLDQMIARYTVVA